MEFILVFLAGITLAFGCYFIIVFTEKNKDNN